MDFHLPAEKKSYWKPTTSNLFLLHTSKISDKTIFVAVILASPTRKKKLNMQTKDEMNFRKIHIYHFTKGTYLFKLSGVHCVPLFFPTKASTDRVSGWTIPPPQIRPPGDDTMALTFDGSTSGQWHTKWGKFVMFHWTMWMFPKIGFTPKSSILIRFSIINHPFWGTTNFWKHPCSFDMIPKKRNTLKHHPKREKMMKWHLTLFFFGLQKSGAQFLSLL